MMSSLKAKFRNNLCNFSNSALFANQKPQFCKRWQVWKTPKFIEFFATHFFEGIFLKRFHNVLLYNANKLCFITADIKFYHKQQMCNCAIVPNQQFYGVGVFIIQWAKSIIEISSSLAPCLDSLISQRTRLQAHEMMWGKQQWWFSYGSL